MKNFVNRPIPRLARYELLLKGIMEASPEGHEDHESIPQVIEVIKSLLKETEPGVTSANQKVDLWRYNSNLVFKPGEVVVSSLSSPTRVSRVRNCLVVGYGFVGRESVAYLYRETPTSAGYGFRMERMERIVCSIVRQLL
jgi:hypothetical protein